MKRSSFIATMLALPVAGKAITKPSRNLVQSDHMKRCIAQGLSRDQKGQEEVIRYLNKGYTRDVIKHENGVDWVLDEHPFVSNKISQTTRILSKIEQ